MATKDTKEHTGPSARDVARDLATGAAVELGKGIVGSIIELVRKSLEPKPRRNVLTEAHRAKVQAQRIQSCIERGVDPSVAVAINVQELKRQGHEITEAAYAEAVGLGPKKKA